MSPNEFSQKRRLLHNEETHLQKSYEDLIKFTRHDKELNKLFDAKKT